MAQRPTIRKLTLLATLALLLGNAAAAQKRQVWNKPLYDDSPFHYGFALGINSFSARTVNSASFMAMDTVFSIETEAEPGFAILMVANLRLADNFDLRFTPGLVFGQRNLHYLIDSVNDGATLPTDHVMRIESTYASFPLLLKYRSVRVNNYRPYVLAGVSWGIDLESEKKIRDEEFPKIRLAHHDFYVEAGFGIDYYFPFFKLSSEIKFSFGLRDLLVRDGSPYTNALEKINSRIVSLLFYFE